MIGSKALTEIPDMASGINLDMTEAQSQGSTDVFRFEEPPSKG
jgi:hypothetical protein